MRDGVGSTLLQQQDSGTYEPTPVTQDIMNFIQKGRHNSIDNIKLPAYLDKQIDDNIYRVLKSSREAQEESWFTDSISDFDEKRNGGFSSENPKSGFYEENVGRGLVETPMVGNSGDFRGNNTNLREGGLIPRNGAPHGSMSSPNSKHFRNPPNESYFEFPDNNSNVKAHSHSTAPRSIRNNNNGGGNHFGNGEQGLLKNSGNLNISEEFGTSPETEKFIQSHIIKCDLGSREGRPPSPPNLPEYRHHFRNHRYTRNHNSKAHSMNYNDQPPGHHARGHHHDYQRKNYNFAPAQIHSNNGGNRNSYDYDRYDNGGFNDYSRNSMQNGERGFYSTPNRRNNQPADQFETGYWNTQNESGDDRMRTPAGNSNGSYGKHSNSGYSSYNNSSNYSNGYNNRYGNNQYGSNGGNQYEKPPVQRQLSIPSPIDNFGGYRNNNSNSPMQESYQGRFRTADGKDLFPDGSFEQFPVQRNGNGNGGYHNNHRHGNNMNGNRNYGGGYHNNRSYNNYNNNYHNNDRNPNHDMMRGENDHYQQRY